MDFDLDLFEDEPHDAELVAIPSGLFRSQSNAVYSGGRKAQAQEADSAHFDVREFVEIPTRVARAASVDTETLQRNRVTSIEYPKSTLSIIDEGAEQTESFYRFSGGPPVLLDDPLLKRPKRALMKSFRERRQARKSFSIPSSSTWVAEVDTSSLTSSVTFPHSILARGEGPRTFHLLGIREGTALTKRDSAAPAPNG